jgi:6-phosphogluconolactonase (cycloisomerase 2 family)
MKLSQFGRAAVTAGLSLGVAAGVAGSFTGCGKPGTNNTVDYVYVTNTKNNPGQVNVYYLDRNSGGLQQIPDSPYPSGGNNPVALVPSPGGKYLYVVNNGEGGTAGSGIVEFGIGTDAKLYPQHTYQGPAGTSLSVPNSVAINTAGTLLFVTYTYTAAGASSLNPSSGALVVYPINTDGSLGAPVTNGTIPYYTLTTDTSVVLTPAAINVVTTSTSSFVYVVAQNSTTGLGSIAAFSVASNGSVTSLPCTPSASSCSKDLNGILDGTFSVGITPNAIASTPHGSYLYVTDSAHNQVFSYAVQATGQILALANSPNSTDVFPDAVTVDPSGHFLYVANYNANDVSGYAITQPGSSGTPGELTAIGNYGTGSGPTCVFVEPNVGSYVYTTNFLDSTVTGLNLSSGGALAPVQNTPFLAAGQPTCIAATIHGIHVAISSTL